MPSSQDLLVASAGAPARIDGALECELLPAAHSCVKVHLRAGQRCMARTGAMIAMTSGCTIDASTGGMGRALRRMASGGNAMVTTFEAREDGHVVLAHEEGTIALIEVAGELLARRGSFLAGACSLELSGSFRGMKRLLVEAGVLSRIRGAGHVLLGATGSVLERVLASGESYVVDPSHLLAFDATMEIERRKGSRRGLVRSVAAGEGTVAVFTGPGRVFIQTGVVEGGVLSAVLGLFG